MLLPSKNRCDTSIDILKIYKILKRRTRGREIKYNTKILSGNSCNALAFNSVFSWSFLSRSPFRSSFSCSLLARFAAFSSFLCPLSFALFSLRSPRSSRLSSRRVLFSSRLRSLSSFLNSFSDFSPWCSIQHD